MSAATILFTDIVSFSKKPTPEQSRIINGLTNEIVYELRLLLNPPVGTPSVIALPTGDGLALAFLHSPDKGWTPCTIFDLILRLQKWANTESASDSKIYLRIGVHVGSVEIITDINGNPNVCGDTINYAQRVMDAANPKQVLFSEAAYRQYIGNENSLLATPPFSDEMKAVFQGPIEIYAKHDLRILVYKMILEPSQPFWSNDDPVTKHLMLVQLTPLPQEVIGTFSSRLEQVNNVALIQLTGDRMAKNYSDGKITLSPALERFWIFMPDPESYAQLSLTKQYPSLDYLKEHIAIWTRLLSELKKNHPESDIKLGLFKETPFWGASFLNWERPGGVIHISPFVWNLATPDCPGYDLQWIGNNPSIIYERYVTGLRYLDSHTENHIPKG